MNPDPVTIIAGQLEGIPFLMPRLGMVTECATVVRWLAVEGQRIDAGTPLLEVETDKAIVEVEAPVDGVLRTITRNVGESVNVGAVLGEIAVEQGQGGGRPAVASSGDEVAQSSGPAPKSLGSPAVSNKQPMSSARKATPAARRKARMLGIDLDAVAASGPGGRLQLRDVDAVSGTPRLSGALSPIRRAIALAMTVSVRSIPQFTVCRTVSLAMFDDFKRRATAAYADSAVRPSITDFLIRAAAKALVTHPDLNATFHARGTDGDGEIRLATGTRVGLVVAVSGGVRVPVMSDAEQRSVQEVTGLRSRLVAAAIAGRLRPGEMEGAVLSISNLGAYGPDRFNAIINPGESYILAVGRRREVAAVEAGQIVIRAVADLTLTADHRLVDGMGATALLNTLVELIEEGDSFLFNSNHDS
jgi:pyruvate dehydrogenase E2 component (dihydrolipoamide acetyltransferase)